MLYVDYENSFSHHFQSGWCSDNALYLYSVGSWFESRPGYSILWLQSFVVVFILSRWMPWSRPRQNPSNTLTYSVLMIISSYLPLCRLISGAETAPLSLRIHQSDLISELVIGLQITIRLYRHLLCVHFPCLVFIGSRNCFTAPRPNIVTIFVLHSAPKDKFRDTSPKQATTTSLMRNSQSFSHSSS